MERYSACPERNLRTFWGLHKSTVQTSWGLFKALCWLGFQGLLHPRKRELCQARTVWSCFHQTQPHLVLHIFDFPDWRIHVILIWGNRTFSVGSELRPWQRSWGKRLGIRKGGIKPQESPWKFSSIYPQNQSLPTFCFVLSPTPLTLRGAVPHYLSLKKELTYSSN